MKGTSEQMMDIHESLVNGQRRQMVKQIDEYGHDFWNDYAVFLNDLYDITPRLIYFQDATISYFRIKNR
jgi:hypothetical protein